jgi:hypothetical protein
MTLQQIFDTLHSGHARIGDEFHSLEGLKVLVIDSKRIVVSFGGEDHTWRAPDGLVFLEPATIS